jgi:hypothetical protein
MKGKIAGLLFSLAVGVGWLVEGWLWIARGMRRK